jgi:regulator of RNase E activity RraA
MTMVSKVSSVKETVIAGGTTVNQGQMYVNGDTNGVIVASATHSATAEVAAQGISTNLKTVDLPVRVGSFPDTGKNIFETLG